MNLARLKQAVPLQPLAIEYLPELRVVGKDLIGLCPFHKERSPSFRVHVDYYKCFGCGAAGDVIDFYAAIEGISKGRAIHALAERFGVPLDDERKTRVQRVYDAEEAIFVDWWWRREVERLARRLSAYARYGTDEEADAAGELWRLAVAMTGEKRRGWVLDNTTQKDREEWEMDILERAREVLGVLCG